MSEPRNSGRDDEGEVSVRELPNKEIKLDQVAQQSEGDVPDLKVKFEDLPEEVITMILSYFSFTELIEIAHNVCRKWRRASHDPLLWRNKDYFIEWGKSDEEVLTILSRVPKLRKLHFCRPVEEAIIRAVCDNCTHLIHLDMQLVKAISNTLLEKLVTSCPNIRSLYVSAKILRDEVKANILTHWNHLETLCIVGNSDKSIHLGILANGCPYLSELITIVTDQISTEDLNQFLKIKCNTLTELDLPWTGSNRRCVVPMLTECSALTCLAMKLVPNNNTELLDAFEALSHLNNLRSLSLEFSFSDGEHLLAFAYSGLSHLQELKIDELYLEDGAVAAICGSFTNLRELHLRYCRDLTDGDLNHLCHLSRLEALCLNDCTELSGEALLHVSRIPNLRKLMLEENDLSKFKEGLPYILNITSLEILSFAWSRYVDYFHLDRIPETLTKLRVLNVAHCTLNNTTLGRLKQQMPGLLVYASHSLHCCEEMYRLMRL